MGAPPSSLSGRQDASGQNTFSDSKFSAAADSTSSPVPSSVGNTVGQQPAFNLGESKLFRFYFKLILTVILYLSFHIHCCSGPAPYSAARLRLFLWRCGRHAWSPVRRGRGWGRSLSWPASRHSSAHSCWPHIHQPVSEHGLWKEVMMAFL